MYSKFISFNLLVILVWACGPSEEQLFQAGIESLERGDFQKSIGYFDRLLGKNETHAAAWNAKGVAYFEQENWDQAIASFDQSISIDSVNYKPFFNRGNALLEKRAYKEAIMDYNMANGLAPEQVDVYYNRGLALLGLEMYEDALIDFDQALQANPNQPQVHFNKAKALLGNNDPMAAISALTEVVNLDKRNAAAYYLLGVTEMSALGRKEEGCSHLKMALSLGYVQANEWIEEFCKE